MQNTCLNTWLYLTYMIFTYVYVHINAISRITAPSIVPKNEEVLFSVPEACDVRISVVSYVIGLWVLALFNESRVE